VDLQPDTGTTEGAAPDGWQSVRGEERTIGCGVGAARRLFTDDGKRQPGRLRRSSVGRQVAYYGPTSPLAKLRSFNEI